MTIQELTQIQENGTFTHVTIEPDRIFVYRRLGGKPVLAGIFSKDKVDFEDFNEALKFCGGEDDAIY